MRSLDAARQACEKRHPGLCAALDEIPLAERESVGSPVVELFRKFDGAGLLVPPEFGGAGAGALDAVRVMRGLSASSPSLGAAVTMHHFTVAMLFSLAATVDRLTGPQVDVLSRVAPDGLLMASGWAEGRPNQNILRPGVSAERDGTDWVLNGSKKPCSLSGSMDLLTASVALSDNDNETDGTGSLAVALVPATTAGITVLPFWSTTVLAGAQSDEVRLTDVRVPDELMIRTRPDDPQRLDDLQTAGFMWFVMLISSVYLGAASTLAADVLGARRGSVTDRASVASGIEAAVGLLEGVARATDAGLSGDEGVAAVLVARYTVQKILAETTDLAVELLGGMAFIRSSDVDYLSSAVRALAFHPPSRGAAAEPLLDYFAGGPLRLS
ncbi:MAG TPA: acyl-CoA dehydrogenase family protein [Pseudonocardiaceae bacterium]|jgi:alkylation response protein AidB-like acyl-CoA dehydrogenase